MSTLKNEELFKLMSTLSELVVTVVDANELNEETYGTNGMIGVIKHMEIQDHGYRDGIIVYQMDIDWIKYADNNIPLESHDWYLKKDEGLGTMKEAGMFPKDGIETLYTTSGFPSGLEILSSESNKLKLYDLWKNSNSEMSYVKWLEGIAIDSLTKEGKL